MTNIESKVENLIIKQIENLGYELYDVEYVKEGKDYFLRIYIDNPNGISLDDCEKVNNEITELLDAADYIKEQYFLEVSSTGVERVLKKDKHLQKNIGEEIQIKLFKPIDKQKQYIGKLKNFNNDEVILEIENNEIKFERKNISQIKTIYKW